MVTRASDPEPLLDFFFFFSNIPADGGKKKTKLKLTTLPRIFIHVVYRFTSIAFAIQR